ncbi:putative membrane protein [Clostridium bornimense]|uniref:Putative membrane protein n=1 Tax=Clostridium bornimense TaxID=1216932 RepID=W6RU85_9CLOT|nr:DUF2809 domain-containing protein [Clostridium bornimense]CDM68181.1 putative membrane protein [Clostridium bornimense]
MKRNRITYLMCIIVVIILGLASRTYEDILPVFIGKYIGDVLWAFMIYLIIVFLFKRISVIKVSLISLLICYGVEFLQLYQSEWINNIRDTVIGSLILGHGFLYTDLICYIVGIVLAVIFEMLFLASREC